MTFRACHLAVGGRPPRFHIDIHLVTEAAEGGGFCKPQEGSKKDEKNDYTENEENLDRFEVGLRPPLCRIKDIDPKGLYQIVKALERFHAGPLDFLRALIFTEFGDYFKENPAFNSGIIQQIRRMLQPFKWLLISQRGREEFWMCLFAISGKEHP